MRNIIYGLLAMVALFGAVIGGVWITTTRQATSR
jgi:hypothetical protein